MILETQSQVSKTGRAIRLHGKKISEKEMFDYLLDAINQGITQINKLAAHCGKTPKQIRRYLKKMESLNLVSFLESGRLDVSQEAKQLAEFEKLSQDDFMKIPEIARWWSNLSCRPRTKMTYKSGLKQIFDRMSTHPRTVLVSKQAFIEFWSNFKKLNDQERGKGHDHEFRIAYRSLGDEFDYHISLSLGKKIGLTSAHDSFKKYAGAAISAKTTQKIGKAMLQDGEIILYTWFRTGVRTGARSGAIATMTWDKIVLDEENFQVAQHETKDDRGDEYLGEPGEWQIKEPPLDLLKTLKWWKSHELSPASRFVFFEDKGSDSENRVAARKVRESLIPKLRNYYQKFYDEMDILTREYAEIEPGHLMRHTAAQLLKEEGATVEEIMQAYKWKSAETVSWYTAATQKEKENIRNMQNNIDSLSEEESKHMEGSS